MQRLRFRDSTTKISSGAAAYLERYQKPSLGCTGSPSWEVQAQHSGTGLVYGRYEHMLDTPDNAPKRKLGTAGYTFNSMTSASVECQLGTGTNWQVADNFLTCVGASPYTIAYRRREAGIPMALTRSGLSIVGIGGLQANVIDLTSYGLPYATIDRMRSLVATSVLSKRGRGSDSNLYETLAEVDKSLAVVADLFTTVKKIYYSAFSRQRGRFSAVLTDSAAGTYLLNRYGFQPTVKDIFNTLLALREELGRRVERTRAQETETLLETTNGSFTDFATFDFNTTLTTETKIVVRAVSVDEYVMTLFDALGLGSKQLITAPWELTKFSFVLDWFLNIGDFIGALAPNLSLHHIGGCISVSVEKDWKWVATYKGLNPAKTSTTNIVFAPSNVSQGRTLKYYNRDPAIPSPSIVMKQDFKFSNATRALDALSLVLQASKLPGFVRKANAIDYKKATN